MKALVMTGAREPFQLREVDRRDPGPARGRIRPMIEVYRLEDANTLFERLDRGAVRYRAVFDLGDVA